MCGLKIWILWKGQVPPIKTYTYIHIVSFWFTPALYGSVPCERYFFVYVSGSLLFVVKIICFASLTNRTWQIPFLFETLIICLPFIKCSYWMHNSKMISNQLLSCVWSTQLGILNKFIFIAVTKCWTPRTVYSSANCDETKISRTLHNNSINMTK